MRHMRLIGRTVLPVLLLGGALTGCAVPATETAMPYGYGGPGATYYEDPAVLGYEPFSGDLAFGGDFGFRRFDHLHHVHHFAGGPGFAHHGFGQHGFAHGGFAHGGFAHGGGGGGHGR